MSQILNTGIKNARNVAQYTFGEHTLSTLPDLLIKKRTRGSSYVIFLIDDFFKNKNLPLSQLKIQDQDELVFISAREEPSTHVINDLRDQFTAQEKGGPCAIVGMGGGTTMDTAKAVANLLTNSGNAEEYQGWDLVPNQGVYKIAIPTLSGTGAEATRTCVMTHKKTGLKLGMNSDFTVYDQVILDPELTKTVPREQYFYTGMDAYLHCIESLNGSYRNAIGDAYSDQTIRLCRTVFLSNDMMSDENRSKLMVASYLGGCAIATSYVGIIHPFSAGLSVVLGLHHCIANCITMRAMEEFYPQEYQEFWKMTDQQEVVIPEGVCKNLTEKQYEQLYASTVIHEKPLTNALGQDFKKVLTPNKVKTLFQKM